MRRNNAALSLLVGMALLFVILPSSADVGDIGNQLKRMYQGKLVTLRHFYAGEHLRFGPDGGLIDQAATGPWTVDAQLVVKDIYLQGRLLNIKGNRVCLCFDSASRDLRDLLAIHQVDNVAAPCAVKRDLLKHVAQRRRVKIEIQLASEAPDLNEISLAISAVFLGSGESLETVVPPFWRDWFILRRGDSEKPPNLDEPVYRVKPGEVSAPRPIYTPDPEYSEPARQAGYSASVVLSLIVDRTGTPREIQIAKPAGLGLDEKAVEAVSAWKFEPGQMDARPVAVKLNVETSFRLY